MSVRRRLEAVERNIRPRASPAGGRTPEEEAWRERQFEELYREIEELYRELGIERRTAPRDSRTSGEPMEELFREINEYRDTYIKEQE